MTLANPVVKVEAAFATGASVDPGVAGATWQDITAYTRAVTTKRGRQRDLDRFEAGTAVITLDNRDRRFEPEFAGGAYYPNLRINNWVRVTAGYMAEVLLDKPSAYYRIGDPTGTTLVDFLRLNNGTYNATGVTLSQAGTILGRFAAKFDGAAGFATTPNVAALTVTTTWTLELWVNPVALPAAQATLYSQDQGANGFLVQLLSTGEVKYLLQGGASTLTTAGAAINTAHWHHVVVVSTAGNITIYVNGVSRASGNPTKPSNANASGFVAKDSAGNFFNGYVDELAMYNATGLAAGRVTAHRNEALKGVSDGFLFTGYTDGWAPTYPFKKDSTVVLQCTDAFKIFSGFRLQPSVWAYQVQALVNAGTVKAWWRLNDPPGTVVAADSGPSKFGLVGAGSPAFGQATVLPWGDASETGVGFSTFTALPGADYLVPPPGAALLGNNWSIEFLMKLPNTSSNAHPSNVFCQYSGANGSGVQYQINVLVNNSGQLILNVAVGSGLSQYQVITTGARWDDDKTHHVVCRRVSNSVVEIYVDGVVQGSVAAVNTGTGQVSSISIGGDNSGVIITVDAQSFQGTLQDVLLYDTALSPTDIATHAGWALTPWNGDLSSARASKAAQFFLPAALVNVASAGASTLQSTKLRSRAGDLLTYLNAIDETEEGLLLMDTDGRLLFQGRDFLYTPPGATSQQTFGDRNNGTDLPTTDLTLVMDEIYLYNESHAGREQGVEFTLFDQTSQTNHGARIHERTDLMHTDDLRVVDHMNWLIYRSKVSHLELRTLVFEPASAGLDANHPAAMWTAALVRGIGDKITVVRTPPGGGAVISKDVRIQGVEHNITEAGKFWTTTFQLSGFTDQYLVWDDATYGSWDSQPWGF